MSKDDFRQRIINKGEESCQQAFLQTWDAKMQPCLCQLDQAVKSDEKKGEAEREGSGKWG